MNPVMCTKRKQSKEKKMISKHKEKYYISEYFKF